MKTAHVLLLVVLVLCGCSTSPEPPETRKSDQKGFYFVTGEVRSPGPKPYFGPIDVIRAIASAGDFTAAADKNAVRITHAATGRVEIVNVQDILDGKGQDVSVYQGDKITVSRM